MNKTDAARVALYIRSLESLAEIVEAEDGRTEQESRFEAIGEGLYQALVNLEAEALGGDGDRDGLGTLRLTHADWEQRAHPLVRCETSDCGEEFAYCDAGNHFCPSCGESGEEAPEA